MYWVLWAIFHLNNGLTVAFPLDIYDTAHDCHSILPESVDKYKAVLGADVVRLKCVGTAKT